MNFGRAPRAASLPRSAWIAILLAAAMLACGAFSALAPPTADEVVARSLALPKNVLAASAAGQVVDSPAAPNLVQMWFLWALALDGPVACNLLQCGLGGLLALATWMLARPIVGQGLAPVAACCLLLCPGVASQLGVPLEDLGGGLFATLALVALRQARDAARPNRWRLTAGLLLGGGCAAQLTVVPFAVAVLATILLRDARPRADSPAIWLPATWHPAIWRNLVPFACGMFAVAMPWLAAEGHWRDALPRQSLQSALAHLGPLLLLGIAGAGVARKLAGLGDLQFILLIYAGVAWLMPGAGRWWTPLAPLAAVLAAWTWHELARLPRVAGLAVRLAALGLAGVSLLTGAINALDTLPLAIGKQSRDAYLASRVATFPAASLLNKIGRTGDDLLCQDARTLYFDCPASGGLLASGGERMPLSPGQPDSLLRRARDRGYSYLLLSEQLESRAGLESQGRQPLAPAAASKPRPAEADECGEVSQILEYRFADDNNRFIRYRLLKIR